MKTTQNTNTTVNATTKPKASFLKSNHRKRQSDATNADLQKTLSKAANQSNMIVTSLKQCASLAEIEAKRISWENNEYKASNTVLYSVLSDCLEYCAPVGGKLNKQRNNRLKAFLEQRKYAVKNDAKLSTKVTRAVFGEIDRKRVSTYAIVIDAALKEKVKPANLAQWIVEKGGIQSIKLVQSETFISPKEKMQTTEQKLEATKGTGLATVKSGALSMLADADKAGQNCVLIATQEADGSFTILSVTHKSSALNAAYLAIYADLTPKEVKPKPEKPFPFKKPRLKRKKKQAPKPVSFAVDLFDYEDQQNTPSSAVNDDVHHTPNSNVG